MRDSVQNAFVPFTTGFEGAVPWMYVDVKGLVTTGIGNLIDPIGSALNLPWLHADGSQASQSEIESEWNTVKNGGLEMAGGGSGAARAITTLHLDDSGIAQLVQGKLASNEAILRSRFPGWDSWPADAQLGVLSMAWADGPMFRFPAFIAAVNATYPDFTTAATESHTEDSNNPGLRPRNKANFILFNNAAAVLSNNLDPTQLFYPQDLAGVPYPFGEGISLPSMNGVSPSTSGLLGSLGSNTSLSLPQKILIGSVVGAGLGYAAYKYLPEKYTRPVTSLIPKNALSFLK